MELMILIGLLVFVGQSGAIIYWVVKSQQETLGVVTENLKVARDEAGAERKELMDRLMQMAGFAQNTNLEQYAAFELAEQMQKESVGDTDRLFMSEEEEDDKWNRENNDSFAEETAELLSILSEAAKRDE